jgi:crotonobetainyl-CoA:carnitine CoA-transferase CaiB-like acyl-CoA transferase
MTDSPVWRPLEGVKILDFTAMLPGPFASQLLADLGATVIKVERPPRGEAMRALQPHMFDAVNRGKHSISVDLKSPDDVELVLGLGAEADVVMEGFRPGVLDRLGVGFEAMRAQRPGILYVSLSGWGQDGPLADEGGHNGTFMARTGAVALTGEPGSRPHDAFPVPVADITGALYATVAILAGLRSPDPQDIHLDVSLFGSALAAMMPKLAEFEGAKATSRDDVMMRPANGTFPCADGDVVIAAIEDHFWAPLCGLLGLDELLERADLSDYRGRFAHTEEVNTRIAAATAPRARDELVAALATAGVPASPVLLPAEVPRDPQVQHLGFLAGGLRAFLPFTGVTTTGARPVSGYDDGGAAIRGGGWGALAD